MRKVFPYIIFFLCLPEAGITAFGQTNAEPNMVPTKRIIFEDGFKNDTVGKFPSKWHMTTIDEGRDTTNYLDFEVKKENNDYILEVKKEHGIIRPNINRTTFPQRFDIEYDFVLQGVNTILNVASCQNLHNVYCTDLNLLIRHKEKKGISMEQIGWYQYSNGREVAFPGISDFTTWHHFRARFDYGKIQCFIDQYRLINIKEGEYNLRKVLLLFTGPLKMKNFRVTSPDSTVDLHQLLTEKKFVTHAINFDVASSSIKPESIDFIRQLAQFLTDHPTLKLEIDGHTDNDGSVVNNEKLSLARAGEVKRQLVLANVSAERLAVNGFGSSKPLKQGKSAEDKAENRRVEFIVK